MNNNKKYLAKIMLASLDYTSCDQEKSETYLIENNFNPDDVAREGIKRIKKLQLQAAAAKKREEIKSTVNIKQQAIEWAEKILNDVNFSFASFVKNNDLVLHNRSMESFNNDDIKHTLTQYFYLKLGDSDQKDHDK